ncbi:hypothetical protein EYF80_045935 [Liparis tanakae]|uniref:Uncharacterized protein n=1 Tax=Liparis tanakae TaxID=230148 RepID=A0A4Z2FSA4_9TELE|nr:hypothetical protein EYF80_045935 [Liparis tanakae]
MRSVIQRYQAGDSSMRGNTGPSMKMLPKKLPRNRVTTKYRPRTDTAICREARHINLTVKFTSGQKSERWSLSGFYGKPFHPAGVFLPHLHLRFTLSTSIIVTEP